jgi:DNA-binding transcriptional LysR family regulator
LLTESFQVADLEAEVLEIENLVLVAHPDHPLARQTIVTARDLEGETILFSKVDCSYRRSLEAALNLENVRYDTTLEFNSVSAIKQYVMTGIGITILPEITVAEDIIRKRLSVLPWDGGV